MIALAVLATVVLAAGVLLFFVHPYLGFAVIVLAGLLSLGLETPRS